VRAVAAQVVAPGLGELSLRDLVDEYLVGLRRGSDRAIGCLGRISALGTQRAPAETLSGGPLIAQLLKGGPIRRPSHRRGLALPPLRSCLRRRADHSEAARG
jgi:hypothetical protein